MITNKKTIIKILAREVGRLELELSSLEDRYFNATRWNDEAREELAECKKEIHELEKSVNVIKSNQPKNYGVKMNVYGEPIKFIKSTDDLIMTVRLDEAVRMTNETAVHLARMYSSANENDHYSVFRFPSYEDLEVENNKLKAELTELKLDNAAYEEIIENEL